MLVTDVTNMLPVWCMYSMSYESACVVAGGRLVFFLPATPETYNEDEVPCHPCLTLVENTEQLLTTRYSRRLITMQQIKKYSPTEAGEYKRQLEGFVMAIDRLHDIVYEKLDSSSSVSSIESNTIAAVHTSKPGANKKKFRGKMC